MPDLTPDSTLLDEIDLQLVAALQREPRADWRRVGALLDVDASTAARRWSRLTGSGLAWLSCYPTALPGASPLVAMIELDCAPGRLHEVAAVLAEDPHLFTIHHVTGGRDLLLTALFTGRAELARYVGFRLGALTGIAATRTQLATTLHAEGSRWRLERGPDAPAAGVVLPGGGSLSDEDLRLIVTLGRDVRQSVTALAERTGLSPTTVRRRLARLERDRLIAYRCEIARSRSGWPVSVTFWGVVPAARVGQATARLAGLRETRMVASLSGQHNIMFTVWLRAVEDIPAFEARLAGISPDLTITDSTVALWSLKHAGRILDPHGRHLRAVPLAPWTDAAAVRAERDLLAALSEGRGGETDGTREPTSPSNAQVR